MNRSWVSDAIEAIEADFHRSADTHMIRLDLEHSPATPIYFKDESTHPTGSLKHRLARSLFLYGLCNGWIQKDTPIIEASSGSTAVSEAYFARLLKLPFTAVVPSSTSKEKLNKIELYDGKCYLAEEGEDICEVSRRLASETGGHFMDQFTYAERATDWRGNNNIAESLFRQLEKEHEPIPSAIVVGAGTGGTSATIGRFLRYHRYHSKLVVVDPENSVFFDYYQSGNKQLKCSSPSLIEGIGRPFVVESFLREIVDGMMQIPDAASLAAILFLQKKLGRFVGASTGTNLIGVLNLLHAARQKEGRAIAPGPVVTLLCDGGERYLDTYFDASWRQRRKLEVEPYLERIEAFFADGTWEQVGSQSWP